MNLGGIRFIPTKYIGRLPTLFFPCRTNDMERVTERTEERTFYTRIGKSVSN